jgi:SpoVK/Ycf46/Vps4 family AAA+-type ATPase
VLLHGPPGVGKSAAVAAVAAEFGAAVHPITAASIFGAFTGQSERRLREAFAAAAADTAAGRAAVVFLDDVDALCPRRRAGSQHEARVVGQLLTLMDGAQAGARRAREDAAPGGGGGGGGAAAAPGARGHLVVIAATSRPASLDPALRRPGRLDREVAVPVPAAAARAAILRLAAARMPLAGDVDLRAVAARCHGYTGADLGALCREAATAAIADGLAAAAAAAAAAPSTSGAGPAPLPPVTAAHFSAALALVGPSVARGTARAFPPASWDDVGGLEDVKKRLRQAVEWPLAHAAAFARLGLSPPRGVLLHGPPGCAKTTLARAAAAASGATFVPLAGAELYSMYVGEGEAALREAFRAARLAAPAIVFVDELDTLVGRRGGGGGTAGRNDASARILSTFLTEMDGLEAAQGVLVLATTNRPHAIDPALLRCAAAGREGGREGGRGHLRNRKTGVKCGPRPAPPRRPAGPRRALPSPPCAAGSPRAWGALSPRGLSHVAAAAPADDE